MGNRRGTVARWPTEPLERPRRGLEERLVLAAPWLVRFGFSIASRGRAGSRLRRATIVHGVALGLAAVNRDDYDAVAPNLCPDIELHMFPDAPEHRAIDFEAVARGRDAYLDTNKLWKREVTDNRWELREFIDPGGNRIAARVQLVALGSASGIPVEQSQYFVWEFERGRLRRQWVFATEAALLAKLGE